MNLQRQWLEGVSRGTREYHLLGKDDRERVRELCVAMVERKEAMQSIAAWVDASTRCAGCGGACCVTGKYHFTPVDLLPYLVNGEPLFSPLFGNGLCPYLSQTGCLMPAGYRPFNCITFNCELIEDLLSPAEVSRFYRLERELRENYRDLRSIFPAKSMDGALLKDAP